MAKQDELEEKFSAIYKHTEGKIRGVGGYEPDATAALALLGIATRRLDRTSGRLAKVNIFLGIVLAAIGTVQIVLMLTGH